ncbi:DUF551 domain-containing protein [Escherichia coli]|uniref:DUF551 domain-containing protein n=1 Tax=Escherichia coli TaxID=562 RepID=A0A5D7Z3B9_ECOLX|nr:DUF551 domain-containing protein [Salmonella enterica]EFJ2089316.1 DUF551 domain-containing protein [Escherichia coli]EGI3101954.1 DUF551 domain-containing protein [Escherichia coli]EGI3102397.1 DUF551 domain-containing protein [Escherichia coli]EGI3158041.1 DUF551 domain-containing protein [Escherichia coli]EGI3158521.1 DUF551 domain-containing protein [Escherichia coli]
MTTFTKEQLIEIIKRNITVMDRYPDLVTAQMDLEVYKIALASLEAEPVAYIFKHPAGKLFWALTDESNKEQPDVIPVYADSPAPVVPDEIDVNDVPRAVTYFKTHRDCYADGWNACRAARLQSGNFRENKNSSTNNFREIAETSTNYPVIPSEVLSAILKVAKIRADFDDFDGDRRGIGDCLDEAEQELIVTINKYASQLAAEPIATNDVREQTAVPPVPVIQADVAQAIEKLKRKLVECNRYNYCADAVKGVEYACHAAMLQGSQPVSQTYKFPVNTPCQDAPAHIWLQTAGVWPEDGELSELTWCSHNQHHDDTLYVRADLVNGNSQVTPDGWISCSERMPAQDDWILIYSKHGEYMAGQVQGEYVELSDGTLSWLGNALFWMLLPEPPQEAGQ